MTREAGLRLDSRGLGGRYLAGLTHTAGESEPRAWSVGYEARYRGMVAQYGLQCLGIEGRRPASWVGPWR